jgi:nicotinate-nucleotide pyrophosphorylase (carboxylating)
MTFSLPDFDLDAFIRSTLAEDMGQGGDATSNTVIPADARLTAVMASRDAAVVAGLPIAEAFFRALDPQAEIETLVEEGVRVPQNAPLMRIAGNARALLTAERSALNTVQHLTGIATLTRQYVDAIANTGCILLDTRKTLPGLRVLEKYATRMGGAQNHRMRLDDGVLIKDNHIAVAGSIEAAVRAAKAAGLPLEVQVEVDTLDHMRPETLREAVGRVAGRVPTEASGGVRLETIRAIAKTGVTYVSVGRLTQSAPAADIGLDYGV